MKMRTGLINNCLKRNRISPYRTLATMLITVFQIMAPLCVDSLRKVQFFHHREAPLLRADGALFLLELYEKLSEYSQIQYKTSIKKKHENVKIMRRDRLLDNYNWTFFNSKQKNRKNYCADHPLQNINRMESWICSELVGKFFNSMWTLHKNVQLEFCTNIPLVMFISSSETR